MGNTSCVRNDKMEKEVDGDVIMLRHDEMYHYLMKHKTASPVATRGNRLSRGDTKQVRAKMVEKGIDICLHGHDESSRHVS